jgi:hypothetical protein
MKKLFGPGPAGDPGPCADVDQQRVQGNRLAFGH